ncbi:hypothetical protein IV203_037131 [Nitzschia inconspicua]|uniref:Uncharacterized protein n=1 Tax=Nitzschia inconspicua TaxID=303405 RepID=A0A9K3Q0Q5_9STRA|nr:hypothetical protein IV203_037131 [Nitzschia inconspicua]
MDYTSGGNSYKYDDNGDDDELQDDGLSSSHPAMAFAARQKRKGWQGEELELEHRRQQMMAKPPSGTETTTVTAVDLNQFRNTEVGEGYQAKHVVRQRTAPTVPVPFSSPPTMTNTAAAAAAAAAETHSRSTIHTAVVSTKTNQALLITKEAMLENTGLREFRKEIEKILSS